LRGCLATLQCLSPKGLDEERKNHLSLFLFLVRCSKSGVQARFTLSILNANRQEAISHKVFRFVQGQAWGLKKFILRDFLFDDVNGLLPRDRLTLLCKVTLPAFIFIPSVSERPNMTTVNVSEHRLADDLGDLLENNRFTDCCLCVRGQEFFDHVVHQIAPFMGPEIGRS
uniref:MATH domain-containing protein n=1 Tax=Eptatretus burgeri TaxID=7764 RepID=A0A8C4WV14_EPTBU